MTKVETIEAELTVQEIAENATWADGMGHYERSLMVIWGGLVILLVGFLGTIWSAGDIEFRAELAGWLTTVGGFFLMTFALPLSRDLVRTSKDAGIVKKGKNSWFLVAVFLMMAFVFVTGALSISIEKAARTGLTESSTTEDIQAP